jgi:L-threonylcarbamoyladenylate synthase
VEGKRLADEAHEAGRAAVLALHAAPPTFTGPLWIEAPDDAKRYAHDLYANLRRLDQSGANRILVEAPPRTPQWEAVNDRLARAAAGASLLD